MSEGSIYWSSKEGLSPPKGALFSIVPFASKTKIPLPASPCASLPNPTHPIRVLQKSDTPNQTEWRRLVLKALEAIREGRLEKVVLARETILTLATTPNPFSVAAALQPKRTGAALFCASLPDGSALVGATPERLFKRAGDVLRTDALAGTEKKGSQAKERLLDSPKYRREFLSVQNYLKETLHPWNPIFSRVQAYATHSLLHLHSEAKAQVPRHISDETLIQTLHPTPALCGAPKQAAADWLALHEPFQRLHYGGVVGWTHETASDWMVAIRSIRIVGNQVHLYAGAGIVEGSNPDEEWEELEAKIDLYREIFPWNS